MESEPKKLPEICPHCGKLGFREEVDGKILYSHGNVADLTSSPITFGFHYCPEPPNTGP